MQKLIPEEIKHRVSNFNTEIKRFGAPFGLGEVVYNNLRGEEDVVIEIEELRFHDPSFPPILGFKYRFMAVDYPYQNGQELTGIPKLSPKQIRKEGMIHTGKEMPFDGSYPCMISISNGYEWKSLRKFLPVI